MNTRHCLILVGVVLGLLFCGCAPNKISKSTRFGPDKFLEHDKRAIAEETSRDKGMRLAGEKAYSTAIQAFMKHVEENPEDFFGFNEIAVCYQNLGDQENALRNFERARELADLPEYRAKVSANIGNLYFSAKQPQDALGLYKEAAAAFDDNPLYLALMAQTHLVLGENERARRILSTVEERLKDLHTYEPSDDKGLVAYTMANCYAALSEEEKVLKYLDAAFKAGPDKYILKFQIESCDPRSLFYTLQGDPTLTKIMDKYKRNKP